MTIYPWQNEIWQHLASLGPRMPHALLLHGKTGIGKLDFALSWSQALLCEQPRDDGHACNTCPSCNWFSQHNHPDYRLLTPDQGTAPEDETPVAAKAATKKNVISVAQIRELGDFLELTSHRGGGLRLVLIHPAEAMNAAAANALLKMLEEPPSGGVFLLVSSQPHKLLPTILSRCRKIDMPVPDRSLAVQWLQQQGVQNADEHLSYASEAPLLALSNAEEGGMPWTDTGKLLGQGAELDPSASAVYLAARGMEVAVSMLQKWVYDLIACCLTGSVHYHKLNLSALQALSKSVDLALLLDFQRKLDEARKTATHPLNQELQLEGLLLQYTQVFSR